MNEFAPPQASNTDPIRRRAANTLYKAGAVALGLALFQFCFNPLWLVTIMAGGASMNALRQPRWMAISMEEDYPTQAGTFSKVAGRIGLALIVLRIALAALVLLLITQSS